MTAGDQQPIDAGGPPTDPAAEPLEQESEGSRAAGEEGPLDGGSLHPGLVEAIEGPDDPADLEPEVDTESDDAEWAEAVSNAVDSGPPPDDVMLALELSDEGLDDPVP